jgi:hypothetical protein
MLTPQYWCIHCFLELYSYLLPTVFTVQRKCHESWKWFIPKFKTNLTIHFSLNSVVPGPFHHFLFVGKRRVRVTSPELVYTIVNPRASLSDLRNRYSPSGLPIRFPSAINIQIKRLKSIDFEIYRLSIGFQVFWIYWWIRPQYTL